MALLQAESKQTLLSSYSHVGNNIWKLQKGPEEAGWGVPVGDTLNLTRTDGWKVFLDYSKNWFLHLHKR